MPFCPRCEQEYEPGYPRCADCDVPLVATLEAARAAKSEAPAGAATAGGGGGGGRGLEPVPEDEIQPAFPEVAFYCPEEKLAAAFERLLSDEQIPAFRYETPVLVDGTAQQRIAVPPEFANYAVRLASARLGQSVVRFGRGVLLAGPAVEADAARKAVPEDAAARIREAEKRGEAGVGTIAAEMRPGAAAGAVEIAAAALARIDGDAARAAALEALAALIAGKADELVQSALTGMSIGSPWAFPPGLLGLFSSPDPLVRALAADAAGILQVEEALPPLVASLSDAETGVRESAIEALFLLTGERFDYDAAAEPRARAAAAARWKSFLESR